MTKFSEVANKLSKFRKNRDYSVSYDESGKKEIYTIHSPEMRQLIFAKDMEDGVVPSEAECKLVREGDKVEKSILNFNRKSSAGRFKSFDPNEIPMFTKGNEIEVNSSKVEEIKDDGNAGGKDKVKVDDGSSKIQQQVLPKKESKSHDGQVKYWKEQDLLSILVILVSLGLLI